MTILQGTSVTFHSRAFEGAVGGLLSAAKVDYDAFKGWQSFQDAAKYAWGKALWRWLQGAVIGAVSGSILGATLG